MNTDWRHDVHVEHPESISLSLQTRERKKIHKKSPLILHATELKCLLASGAGRNLLRVPKREGFSAVSLETIFRFHSNHRACAG